MVITTGAYHHCSNCPEYIMTHRIVKLIGSSKFGQRDCPIDVIAPCRNRIVRAHDGLYAVSVLPKVYTRSMEGKLLKTLLK